MGTELILSEGGHTKYLRWLKLDQLICVRCGKVIHPGDQIHRSGKVYTIKNPWEKRCNPLGSCRFWHLKCYEELFVEL